MSLSGEQRRAILVRLDGHVPQEQLDQAKLILRAFDVPCGDVETVKCVSGLYKVIERNIRVFMGYDAVAVLQYTLQKAGVALDKVKELGSNECSLDACQKGKKLASLVCCLYAGPTDDEFDKLKDLAQERIDIHPGKIPTREKFFHICLNQELFESEEELVKFKGWLKTMKRDDLARKVEEYKLYIKEIKQDQFPQPKRESQSTRQIVSLRKGLVVGASNKNSPGVPTPAADRGGEIGKDDRSVQEIFEPFPAPESVIMEAGSYSAVDQHQPAVQYAPRARGASGHDEAPYQTTEETEKQSLLKHQRPVDSSDSGGSDKSDHDQASCWSRLPLKSKCVLCGISACLAIGLLVSAVFTSAVGYHGHVNVEPQEFELRAGDTCECGQLGWLVSNCHVKRNATAYVKSVSDSSTVQLKLTAVNIKQLETLRKTKMDTHWGDIFNVSESRSTIPRGPNNRLPYTMTGSHIYVSICLQSDSMTPINAHLYFFDSRSTDFNFLHNHTNSTQNAVYNTSLEVGIKGKMLCQKKEYPVVKSAYYRIGLEAPVGVIVTNNITLDVVYIDGSNLTQVELCLVDSRVPCAVGIGLSVETHTLLCYYLSTVSFSSSVVYLIVENIPRFVFDLMKIFGVLLIVVLLLFGLLCGFLSGFFYIMGRRRNQK